MRRICLISLLLLPVVIFAQSLHFKKYNVEDGLNQSNITSIVQDKTGLLWMGTYQGANRFDGNHFEAFLPDPSDTNYIRNNIIRCLFRDLTGNVWLGGMLLTEYNHDLGFFKTYAEQNKYQEINTIAQDNHNNLWLSRGHGGISMFDIKKKTFQNIEITAEDVHGGIIDLHSNFWKIADHKKISCFNIDQYYLSGKPEIKKIADFSNVDFYIHFIIADLQGTIWVGTQKGLFYYDEKKNAIIAASEKYKELSKLEFPVYHLSFDQKGRMWIIGNNNNIYSISFANKAHPVIKEIIPLNVNFNDRNLLSILVDEFESLWLCTDNGLYKANLNENNFNLNSGNPLYPKTSIYCLAEDNNNNLWISSKLAGITCIDEARKTAITYQGGQGSPILIRNRALCMMPAEDNYMFVGGNGLFKIDLKNRVFKYAHPIPGDSTSLPEWVLWSITRGKKTGSFWFGTNDGFCRLLNPEADKSIAAYPNTPSRLPYKFKLYHKATYGEHFPGAIIWGILEAHDGMVWFATDNGLGKLDPLTNKMKRYRPVVGDSSSLSGYAISCVFEDSKNRIWACSEGGGLNLYNNDKDNFSHYFEKDGISSDIIWGILEDHNGILWLSTTRGLTKFDPNKKVIRNYYAADGLQSNEFNRGAYFKSKDGKLIFGGINGLNEFYPDSIKDNPYPARVFINGIDLNKENVKVGEKINGRVILSKQANETDEIILSHKDKILTIQFTALHFAVPEKNRCIYILDGFEKKWNKTTSPKGSAHYTNLEPGKYKLRIRAANCDGLWGKERTLVLIIKPPFWKTWWFILLMISGIIWGAISFYNYRMYSIKQKNQLLEETVKERTQKIEQQKEELKTQAESLQESNVALKERQEELEVATEELRTQSEELYSVNNELLKMNATKDKFFSIIAHDLKNPFQAILGFSDILNKKLNSLDSQSVKDYIAAINSSSKNAFNLLENLLEWARTQTNRISFEPRLVDLKEVVEAAFQLLQLNAENKKVKLVSEVPGGVQAYADKNMVSTVVRNIINNAIKFTPGGGSITITAGEEGFFSTISIKDTGIGMDEETMAGLFRVDQAKSTSGTSGETGTGLGLIICKEFAEKNHGDINVSSEPGKGTCFTILLPKDKLSFEQSTPKITHAAVEVKLESMLVEDDEPYDSSENEKLLEGLRLSILIIEDNITIRQSIVSSFSSNYELIEAADGEEGIQKAFEILPDLIISDVMMPKMDGFQVCKKLKTDERTSHIPVILLTAKSSDNSKMKGLETGADDYITKPFNPSLLLVRARNLIIMRRKLSMRFSKKISVQPSDIAVNTVDENFVARALKIVEEHISDSEFGVDQFVDEMAIGRTQLYKKIKSLTNQSINDFIRSVRLKRSAQLLLQKNKTISEIAYETGFNYPEYFTKCFKKEFGVLPTEFSEHVQKD